VDVFADIESRVAAALEALKAEGELPADVPTSNVEVETPRDPTHGDLATNAAMVLAKPARMKPRDIADKLQAKLSAVDGIDNVSVAGPGFINLTLKPAIWQSLVRAILEQGGEYGRSSLGKGKTVDIEYVSANPTGPMHVGHCRGAVFGDVLANLLAFVGYGVTREYYVNDAGGQVDVLARSVFLRYREALGEDIGDIPQGLYPGDYLKPVGSALAQEHGPSLLNMPEERWLPIVRTFAITEIMPMIKEDLAALNIKHDVFFSEASLTRGDTDKVKEAVAALRAKGLIYEGRLPRPKGHDDEEWEDREQTLFKSTEFGDEVDRALMKSDGTYTYFAGDVAYHYDKLQRGYKHLVNVFGADHIGYIPRMLAVVAAFTGGSVERQRRARRQGEAQGVGDDGRHEQSRDQGGQPRQAVQERRALQDVEAGRHVRHAARRSRRGWTRSRALHDALPKGARAARLRPRQGRRAVEGQPCFLRAVRARPRRFGVPQCARSLP
jgi:arginyl-tRNA synthetase